MNFQDRLADICARMREAKLELIVAVHDGAHFIEKPNPVTVITGFKSLGPAAALLRPDGETILVVSPAWDAERAAAACPQTNVVGARDLVASLLNELGKRDGIGLCGMRALPASIMEPVAAAVPGAPSADKLVFEAARTKTDEEIASARDATRIAELGYSHLLDIARPGVTEDQLAVELKWQMKSLGAEDNFLLLCAGSHNRAVQPSTGRKLQKGDIVLAEITPSVRGQLAQICRTVVIGTATDELVEKYALVVHAMDRGIAAARPGVPMAEVCRAINAVLEAKGYGEYCHPPHIRRRGHGLGFASTRPGDVALDNETPLEPGMVFMIHPNQYLPETGYLLCGEPVVMTEAGAQPLTLNKAALASVAAQHS
jgi:Xaa-Pro aminopeptidase